MLCGLCVCFPPFSSTLFVSVCVARRYGWNTFCPPGLQRSTPGDHYLVINPHIKDRSSRRWFAKEIGFCLCVAAFWPFVYYSVLQVLKLHQFAMTSYSPATACWETRLLCLIVELLVHFFWTLGISLVDKDYMFAFLLYPTPLLLSLQNTDVTWSFLLQVKIKSNV